jgi:hypothetical protein
MAIERSTISSVSILNTAIPTVLEILATEPPVSGILPSARPPGQLLGYYNGTTDTVDLYIVSNTGLRLLRVG